LINHPFDPCGPRAILHDEDGDEQVSLRSDQELVYLARAGDKEAFGQLAERFQEVAWRIALRMVAREDIAQELVQEALLQAYLSLDRLREAERFKSWLLGIVLNLCKNYLRSANRGWGPENLPAESFDPLRFYTGSPEPEKVAEERELHRLVLSAVEELPPNQGEATLLFYYEFLSVQEIANLLGISVGAVKVRLNRARNGLRHHLQRHYPEIERETRVKRRRPGMLRVSIMDVVKREDEKYVVMLKEESGERVLPIWIGSFEGFAIAMGVRGFQMPRPLTFNFIASILQAVDVVLEEVRVEALKSETFYGVAKLRSGEQVREIDARPSDVLALAARTGSPIYVTEEVMARAGVALQEIEASVPGGEGMDQIMKELAEGLSAMSCKLPEEGAG
jgi:RNA polymerase sigma factor (sigma-70 family)